MTAFRIWPVSFLLVIAAFVITRLAIAWFRYRGERLITCPENLRPAGVRVDARHAAANSLLRPAELRLSACSRWPERAGCGQECLSQIVAAPEGCLVRHILAEWYAGKSCASCGRPFGNVKWDGAKPAIQTADKVTVEWKQIPVADLPQTLKTALPVCFACHMASTLVREHPQLALDRSRVALPSRSTGPC
jgi:hypothetical protein